MKVRFLQSGGFVGVVKECELDTDELGPEQTRELERLVSESGIAGSQECLSKKGRDLQQYEIVIESASRRDSALYDDSCVPPLVRPLVSFLKKHAKPAPVS
ncbi:MAG: hypothetical protein HYS13_20435 [Planctomycetia bacterium]|nr:hypothetical protein [Planctomycetia bacterium]